MPWSAASFKAKHAKKLTLAQARSAAHQANAMIAHGVPEGESIATAIKHAKKSTGAKSVMHS